MDAETSNLAVRDCFVTSQRFGRLHYIRAGKGPTIFLMHSNGHSSHEFDDVIPVLARTFDVIAWDQPGHGESDALRTHMTMTDYADAASELLAGVAGDVGLVAGTSIGGAIAVAFANRYPSQAGSIGIFETNLRPAEWWASTWSVSEELFGTVIQSHDEVAARVRRCTPELLRRWNIDRGKAGVKSMMSVMWALREYDLASALRACPTDVLLVFGADGPTIATRPEYERILPDAQIAVIEDAGHFVPIDQPVMFAQAVIRFLADREAKLSA